MQSLAGPDLPHTSTTPMQWLATATAVAGVVALASLVQPTATVPTASAATSSGARPAPAATAPDARAAHYPLDCGPNPVQVTDKVSGDLDGDGGPETVAVVRCKAEMGTPPSGVYVLATPSVKGAAPRVVATLVDPREKMSVQDLGLTGRAVRATLLGYSATDVPRCCPDVRKGAKWQWQNGKFVQSELPASNGDVSESRGV
ncbi:hypothetical protein C3486_19310 [Streptomyces sp. Ru73]|uniref:hypothetical protein n=1 Tax=Streptomyces sp. Ru73 TaxID=2080748 RepID=UPI000CDD0E88|nr:hypothetical protein [Streptomyces sp. Ru73]POX39221.1 hypothetical protein C3486_19310 [Streptomyces sp. Ru73]